MIFKISSDRKWLLLASSIFIVLGIAHIFTDVLSHLLPQNFLIDPETSFFMKNDEVKIYGSTKTVYRYLVGFSNAMGVMMIFFGCMNVFLVYKADSKIIFNKIYLFLNGLCAATLAIFSVLFFNIPPVIFLSVSSIIFWVYFFKSGKYLEKKSV